MSVLYRQKKDMEQKLEERLYYSENSGEVVDHEGITVFGDLGERLLSLVDAVVAEQNVQKSDFIQDEKLEKK